MNGKVPPHNEDAERSVLGAGLLSRDALSDTLELIEEEDFYNKSNAAIFHVMKEMYNFAFMWYTICCVNQVQYFSKEKYIL